MELLYLEISLYINKAMYDQNFITYSVFKSVSDELFKKIRLGE